LAIVQYTFTLKQYTEQCN